MSIIVNLDIQQLSDITYFFFAVMVYCANLFEALNYKLLKKLTLMFVLLYNIIIISFMLSFMTYMPHNVKYIYSIVIVLMSSIVLVNRKTFECIGKYLHTNLEWNKLTHRIFFSLSFYVLLYPFVVLSINSESNLAIVLNGVYEVLNLVSFQIIMFVMSFVGIGFATRRTIKQCISRLDIGIPNLKYALFGVALLFIVDYIIWGGMGILSKILGGEIAKKTVEESSNVENVVNLIRNSAQSTFQIALVSVIVGISEELLFRGALQPRFGKLYTSLLFASLHFQYLSIIAITEIFIISYVLCTIKEKTNTSTTIVIHALYDFVSLMNILP